MLSCIYWGRFFGGAITSILFNIPRRGLVRCHHLRRIRCAQGGEALTAAFTSSFIGSLVGCC